MIEHLRSVVHDRQIAPHEADVVGLPLTGRLASIHRRSDAAVQRARAVRVWRAAVVVQDLDLIPPAQPDPAVGALHNPKLDVRVEIPEGLVGDDVRRWRRVLEHTVGYTPLHLRAGHERMPALEILTVK